MADFTDDAEGAFDYLKGRTDLKASAIGMFGIQKAG